MVQFISGPNSPVLGGTRESDVDKSLYTIKGEEKRVNDECSFSREP